MLLGLDLGTTNVKAVAVEADGRVLARGAAPVAVHHGADGQLEQDICQVWSAMLSALSDAGKGADLAAVEAVGVSSQGGALQLLDGDGQPAGPVISWLDGRGRSHDRRLTEELGGDWFTSHTGHGAAGLAVGQLLRLREEDPGALAPPNGIGFVGDVIVGRLCGRRAHDATSLSIGMLFNPQLGRADSELLERLGVAEGQLPDLAPAHLPAGSLLEAAAGQTGLPAGIPVSPAMHDQYAATLGCGAVRSGDVMFGAGTAWVLLALAEAGPGALRPVVPRAFACTHPVAGLAGQMLSMVNGGSSFQWAVELMGLGGRGGDALDAMMESVPPGSDGLRFRPLLAPGGGAGLDPGTRGRLDGLRLSHGPAHVLRAVVEGLVMELVRHVRLLAQGGLPVERLIMCGGAAGSRVTPQVLADASGLPVACVTEGAVSALGAAVLARAMAEGRDDLARLAREMAPPVREFRPGPDAEMYKGMLAECLASLPARKSQ